METYAIELPGINGYYSHIYYIHVHIQIIHTTTNNSIIWYMYNQILQPFINFWLTTEFFLGKGKGGGGGNLPPLTAASPPPRLIGSNY